jgi:steroid delta-isomerase-like uncharacterized protein
MSTEQNKAMVRRFVDAVVARNLSLVGDSVAENFVLHLPGSPDLHGREGAKQWAQMLVSAFPDQQVTIVDLVAEGDKVVKQWTFRATHRGPLMGIPASGKEVTFPALSLYRFAGGQIAELWIAYDTLTILQQIGAMPAPEHA